MDTVCLFCAEIHGIAGMVSKRVAPLDLGIALILIVSQVAMLIGGIAH
jgi:hypothetical protein